MPYLWWKRFKEEIEYISPRNFYLLDLGSASGQFINFIDQKKKNKKNTFLGIE